MTYCCVLRLWSLSCVTFLSWWYLDLVALLSCDRTGYLEPEDWQIMWDRYGAFRQPKLECGCCEMLVFRGCGARQNFYVFSLCRNPDLDDPIYDCLLINISKIRTCVPLVICWWSEWPSSELASWVIFPRIVTELELLTSQLFPVAISWLLAKPKHVHDGTLDQLITVAHNLIRLAVEAPRGNLDHSPVFLCTP